MIQASHLSKEYDGKKVLGDVSFSISSPKGVHGILGPKGAGKSTLMDLLSGCDTADGGEILLQGKALDAKDTEWKRKIGYVPELPDFYEKMTVLETLDFVGDARNIPADKRYRQMKEALELLGLDAIQHRLIGRLTGDEKKKVALAAALLGNTDVVLIDEPVWGAVAAKQKESEALIRMLGKHKTVLVAGEDLSMLRDLCEDVLILSEGEVIAQGTFEELENKLRHNGEPRSLEEVYASLVELSKQTRTEEPHGELFSSATQHGKERKS